MSNAVNQNNCKNYITNEINQSYAAQAGRIAICAAVQGYQWIASLHFNAFDAVSHAYGVRNTLDELTFYDMREKREGTYQSQEAFYRKIEDALDRLKAKDKAKYVEVSKEYQEYRQYVEEKPKAEKQASENPDEGGYLM